MTEPFIYPFKHYDDPVYWSLPDDGAKIRCHSCKKQLDCKDVILTQIPKDNSRQVLCSDCVDEDWLEQAKYLGEFKD